MPELPEVETMRRGILEISGRRIQGVQRMRCRLKPISIKPRIDAFRRRAVGQRIVDVGRVGKRVILELENQDRIVFEPRMTGLVLVAQPPNREHLRFQLDLAGRGVRCVRFWDRRGLGSVRLLSPSEFAEQFGEPRLGPDALSLSVDALRSRLAGSRRAIKVALLDQQSLAGIGNLYASEILHVAGIHPARPCDRLTRAEWCRIHASMVEVLEEAIRYEGSTLADGTYRTALNGTGGYQNHHRVYARADQACPGCANGIIQRTIQAQRSTFHCPVCQPKKS